MAAQKNPKAGVRARRLAPLPRNPKDPRECGWVDGASWLSENVLLLVGKFHAAPGGRVEAALVHGDHSLPIKLRHSKPSAKSGLANVMLAELPKGGTRPGLLGQLVMGGNGQSSALWPPELSQAVTDLRGLLRDNLAGLTAPERAEVLALASSASGASTELTHNLIALREALRERLPSCVIAADSRLGLHVDAFAALDEKSFYIKGWMYDPDGVATSLTAVSPEGRRAELLGKAFRCRRPDVEHLYGDSREGSETAGHGFYCYFELDAPSRLADGWIVELRDPAGDGLETTALAPIRAYTAARDLLLNDFADDRRLTEECRAHHLQPALTRLQQQRQKLARTRAVAQYGTPPPAPQVSIIVPLYKRIDFLEQQLAQFVHDPEISQADLVYVLDSPELAEDLKEMAGHLFQLYRVPFRLAVLTHNVGFSGANNVGASLARGKLLLLLNSDILPDRPGWLGRMATFYKSQPGIGALGAKLLFEDESIQHAGLYFSPLARFGEWENLHYFKGLHRSLPAANVGRPVPAVTAACLMIDRALFQNAGGLRGIYVQGDYEDSDLCLRLAEQGLQNWYFPEVELYHLEGQSYDLAARSKNGRYNRWLHTRLWGQQIESTMSVCGI